MKINQVPHYSYNVEDEFLLIESLSKTGLISTQALYDIKHKYNTNVPYHNFIHALKVAQGVIKLSNNIFNIIEIKSLFIAALFHDAGHTGVAKDLDEFRSLDIAFQGIMDFEKKYGYSGIDYSIVRKAIIGTVFKNRGKNTDLYAIILADLDISTIGLSFPEFLYFCDFPVALEIGTKISEWKNDVDYFKFLADVDKNIFRSREVAVLFPEAHKNMKKYITLDTEKFQTLFDFYIHKSHNFSDFETYYNALDTNKTVL